jgi:hypothetical protein
LFSRKNLGESTKLSRKSSRKLNFFVLEPISFGSNQMRLSAAPVLLKWPFKSCHHRYLTVAHQVYKLYSWFSMFFGAFSSNLHFRENISQKVFAKTFREKLTKFRENQYTFRQSFRFRERSKKCFRPNPKLY